MARPIYYYNPLTSSNFPKREIGIGIQFQNPVNNIQNLLGTSTTSVNQLQVFTSTYTTKEQTKNQLINFILTNPGERFFDPNFGSGIRSYLFEQNTDLEGLSQTLQDKIEMYVQNIKVNDVFIAPGTSNELNININYSIWNQQDTLNVTITNDTI